MASSLLLLPDLLRSERSVGVLTISARRALAPSICGAGLADDQLADVAVQGVDPGGEFATAILGNRPDMDLARAGADVVAAAVALHAAVPELGTSCSNAPTCRRTRRRIREATGLRVLSLLDSPSCATRWPGPVGWNDPHRDALAHDLIPASRALAVLDRPRRHLHRRRGPAPDGTLVTHKLLSDTPSSTATPPWRASATCWASAPGEPITPERVECVKMGTTVATNALLERKGEPHAAGDDAGLPRRAAHRLPEPAAAVRPPHRAARAAVQRGDRGRRARRRATATGAAARRSTACARTCWPRSATAFAASPSCSCTATATRAHEQAAARLAREAGFTQVSASHETSPLMKFVSRGDTTVVDAYLSPILRRYVDQVAAEMPGVQLFFMQSSGGLTDAHASRARTRSSPARPAASSAWCARPRRSPATTR